ncbi:thioredoxin family protein [Patescibacteria group bacterium]|nr:thioredoxin family protein [Patescibacteria group bacterium]
MEGFNPTFPQFKDGGNGNFSNLLKEGKSLAVFFLYPKINSGEPLNMAHLVEDLATRYGGQVRFLWIDWDADMALCKRLGLRFSPVLVLFSGGREIASFVCSTSEPGISFILDGLVCPDKINSGIKYLRRVIPLV